MLLDTNKQDGDKYYQGHQKQRRDEGVAILRRGMKQEDVGVNGGSSHIHHDRKHCSQKKKGCKRPFQSSHYHLLLHVFHRHEVLPRFLERLSFHCSVTFILASSNVVLPSPAPLFLVGMYITP